MRLASVRPYRWEGSPIHPEGGGGGALLRVIRCETGENIPLRVLQQVGLL